LQIRIFKNNNKEIIKNIQETASSLFQRSVTFFWIPAHKNIPGNEKVDEAAKEVPTNNNTPKIELSYLKDTIRRALENSKKSTPTTMGPGIKQ